MKKLLLSGMLPPKKKLAVTAVVVPQVTCNLPIQPIPFNRDWKHLSDIQLADLGFCQPSRIDIFLGVDIFVEVLLHGRRIGPPGYPVAFEMQFGWVLAGKTDVVASVNLVATHHTSVVSHDDILRKFGEIEENETNDYLQRRELSCTTSRTTTSATRVGFSLCRCQENLE